jgi:uncharacterized protein Yka (UPF0111/DUF47 family)
LQVRMESLATRTDTAMQLERCEEDRKETTEKFIALSGQNVGATNRMARAVEALDSTVDRLGRQMAETERRSLDREIARRDR